MVIMWGIATGNQGGRGLAGFNGTIYDLLYVICHYDVCDKGNLMLRIMLTCMFAMWHHSSSEHFIYPNKNNKNAVYFFLACIFGLLWSKLTLLNSKQSEQAMQH